MSTTELSPRDKAILLIRAITSEIKLGTKHYDKKGRRLYTVKHILEALARDKEIQLKPTAAREHLYREIVDTYGMPFTL